MMSTPTRACPNCGSAMQPKFMGDMLDKILVCPACGTTMDVADNFKRVKTVRREKGGGLFGRKEVIEEQIHEMRADAVPHHPPSASFGTPPPQNPAQPTFGQQPPIVVNIPTAYTGGAVKAAGCGCGIWILLFIVAMTVIPIGAVYYFENGELPFGIGHSAEDVDAFLTIEGHQSSVDFLAYSPDGTRVLSSNTWGLWLWDAATGAPIYQIDDTSIGDIAGFSGDGQLFANTSSQTIQIRNSSDGTIVRSLRTENNNNAVLFTPDGKYLIVGYYSEQLRLLDSETGEVVRRFSGAISPYVLKVSPDGQYVAAMDSGGSLFGLWEIETGTQIFYGKVRDESFFPEDFALGPDGKVAFANSSHIYIYEASESGLSLDKDWEAKGTTVSYKSVAFSHDGNYLATGDFFNSLQVWDIDKKRADFEMEPDDGINSVVFSPDDSVVVAGGTDQIFFYRIGDAEESSAASADTAPADSAPSVPNIVMAELNTFMTIGGHEYSVDFIAYSPNGTRVLTTNSSGIWLWDAQLGSPVWASDSNSGGTMMGFHPDGNTFVHTHNQSLYIRSAQNGDLVKTITTSNYNNAVIYTPDGKYLVVGYYTRPLIVLDSQTGTIVRTLPGEITARYLVATDKYIAALDSGLFGIWEAATGRQVFYDSVEESFYPEQFVIFGDTVVFGYGDTLTFYNITDSGLQRGAGLEPQGDDFITSFGSIAITPDGTSIAAADYYNVFVWDVASKRVKYHMEAEDSINSLAFSADGSVLVGGTYEEILFWQTGTPQPIQPVAGDSAPQGGTVPTPTSLTSGQAVSSCLIGITTSQINIRESPSTDAPIAARLNSGTTVNGQFRGEDGYIWWRLADGRGWVREDVVRPGPDCVNVQQVQP